MRVKKVNSQNTQRAIWCPSKGIMKVLLRITGKEEEKKGSTMRSTLVEVRAIEP